MSDHFYQLLILGRKRGGNFPSVSYVNFLRRRQEKHSGRCPEGKYPPGVFPISGSGHRIWQVRMEIETSSSPMPPSDLAANPTSAAAALPQRKRKLSKRRGRLSQCGQSAPPREPPPLALLPSKPHTSCVCHLRTNSVRREEHTACIVIHFSRPCALR